MAAVDIRNIDLNLLVSADVLLREASITRAARQLGVTQPATSQRLSRLRELFEDPLLVRRGGRMARTPFAEQLLAPLARALSEIEAMVGRRTVFEPRTARRRFVLATTDLLATVLLPGLMARLLATAPAIGIDVRHIDVVRYDVDLERGHDLAVSVLGARPGVVRRRLFSEHFLCLARAGHPLLEGRRTAERFVAFPHVVMSTAGGGPGIVDEALATHHLSRNVVLRVPTFAMAPAVLEATDALMTLPARLARHYAERFALVTFPPPLRIIESFAVHAAWSSLYDGDPALRWLVEQLVAVSRTSLSASPRPLQDIG